MLNFIWIWVWQGRRRQRLEYDWMASGSKNSWDWLSWQSLEDEWSQDHLKSCIKISYSLPLVPLRSIYALQLHQLYLSHKVKYGNSFFFCRTKGHHIFLESGKKSPTSDRVSFKWHFPGRDRARGSVKSNYNPWCYGWSWGCKEYLSSLSSTIHCWFPSHC